MKQRQKTILVVDDALDVRKILGFHLANKGYEVLEAVDGLQGLKMIEAAPPDLLILDINMPKMSGLDVYSELIKSNKRVLFPIIVLTTHEELRSVFKDLEVEGFINKPFEIAKVLEEIDTVIRKRYEAVESRAAKKIEGPIKALIVEDNKEIFEKMLLEFATAGFMVSYAKGAAEAIEKLMFDLPHIILVNLGLSEISGDVFVVRLKNMPRTTDIPCFLYAKNFENLDQEITDRINTHTQSKLLPCEPAALIKEINALLR